MDGLLPKRLHAPGAALQRSWQAHGAIQWSLKHVHGPLETGRFRYRSLPSLQDGSGLEVTGGWPVPCAFTALHLHPTMDFSPVSQSTSGLMDAHMHWCTVDDPISNWRWPMEIDSTKELEPKVPNLLTRRLQPDRDHNNCLPKR